MARLRRLIPGRVWFSVALLAALVGFLNRHDGVGTVAAGVGALVVLALGAAAFVGFVREQNARDQNARDR